MKDCTLPARHRLAWEANGWNLPRARRSGRAAVRTGLLYGAANCRAGQSPKLECLPENREVKSIHNDLVRCPSLLSPTLLAPWTVETCHTSPKQGDRIGPPGNAKSSRGKPEETLAGLSLRMVQPGSPAKKQKLNKYSQCFYQLSSILPNPKEAARHWLALKHLGQRNVWLVEKKSLTPGTSQPNNQRPQGQREGSHETRRERCPQKAKQFSSKETMIAGKEHCPQGEGVGTFPKTEAKTSRWKWKHRTAKKKGEANRK